MRYVNFVYAFIDLFVLLSNSYINYSAFYEIKVAYYIGVTLVTSTFDADL